MIDALKHSNRANNNALKMENPLLDHHRRV